MRSWQNQREKSATLAAISFTSFLWLAPTAVPLRRFVAHRLFTNGSAQTSFSLNCHDLDVTAQKA